jgi:cytochrome b
MKTADPTSSNADRSRMTIPVWDLPTRLFHWLLVVLVAVCFVTARAGINAMQYHEWSGVMILMLLVFRVIWGVVGSQPSRFADFIKGPGTVRRYTLGLLKGNSGPCLGHNPLGGWSVLAMLLAVLLQACLGLFANDDIITEGPLYLWVSKSTSDSLTRIHRLNQYVIMGLAAIHLFAILYHLFVKGENLIKPMFTGVKPRTGAEPSPAMAPSWLAAAVAVLSAGAVYLIVY